MEAKLHRSTADHMEGFAADAQQGMERESESERMMFAFHLVSRDQFEEQKFFFCFFFNCCWILTKGIVSSLVSAHP